MYPLNFNIQSLFICQLACTLFAICGIFAKDTSIENQEMSQEISKCAIQPVSEGHTDKKYNFKTAEKIPFLEEKNWQNLCKKWDIFADILFWRADQIATWALSALDVASDLLTVVDVDSAQNNVLFDWSTGFRGGASYRLDHDFWDIRLSYTWFHARKKERAPGITMISALLGNWLSFGLDPFLQPIASAVQWAISLNMFDWQLCRNYFVSSTISFQPSLGIKGGWIHQTIHSQWQLHSQTSIENLKNNFWGVGPQLGLNSHWNLLGTKNHAFYLFGDGAFAFLYGCWTFKDKQKTSVDLAISSFTDPSKTYAGTFMLQGLMGLGWDVCLNKNKARVSLKLGLETQLWFDQLKVFTFLEGTLHNTLTFQGGTFDLALSF